MGFAACAFDLPPQTFVGKIACTPVLGYPRNAPGATFMNRDPDYVQVLGWDSNPQRGSEALARYGTGKFAPEDGLYGMAADIVEIGGAAAFVGFAEMQRGCIGYGDNYFNLPPIVRDGPGIQPTDTDIASGVVTIPADWSTGRMVSLIGASSSGGLMPPRGKNFVYFLRKVGDRAFTFHPTLLDAQNDTNIKKPTAKITVGVPAGVLLSGTRLTVSVFEGRRRIAGRATRPLLLRSRGPCCRCREEARAEQRSADVVRQRRPLRHHLPGAGHESARGQRCAVDRRASTARARRT